MDGDGRGDIVVAGEKDAYVVLGRAETAPADVLAGPGIVHIEGVGGLPAGLGDVDGDGRTDLAFGDPERDGSCRTSSGAVTIVRSALASPISLLGDEPSGGLGAAVAGVGDMTGDGRADLATVVYVRGRAELQVHTVADTGIPAPRRGRCLVLSRVTRTLLGGGQGSGPSASACARGSPTASGSSST